MTAFAIKSAKNEMNYILEVENLVVSAHVDDREKTLLKDISFGLHPGETLCIAGESGSGKSITSLAIMGLLPFPGVRATSGSIKFDGQNLLHLPEREQRKIRGKRIAMIFQEPMTSLNPVMSIGAQLIEAIIAHGAFSKSEARLQAIEALKSVRISEPEERLSQFPHQLSGGMRQRVMIAMALALKPEILIADEPTTALDVTVQREILDLLRDLQAETNTAIILITHDMGVVAEMADRVIVMQSGHVVELGDVTTIFAHPQKEYTKKLLAAVPRMGNGGSNDASSIVNSNMLEPIAILDDLSVGFDINGGLLGHVTHRVHAVEHVSLTIRQGETFALVGESGCGKSTLSKAMVGLVPHEGFLQIAGRKLAELNAKERRDIRKNVQMVFQDPMAALDARMRVGELVEEPLIIHHIGTKEERRRRVKALFNYVGLPSDTIQRYPHEFSGGQRQRICIARALAVNPKLIICDESVSALDVSVQAQVLQLLKALQNEFNISYLFISHDMAVVENISDRVAVMYLGQIVERGTRQQIFGNPQHSYTKRLISAVPVPDPGFVRPTSERLLGEIPSPVWPVGSSPKRLKLVNIGEGHLVSLV